MPYFIQVLQCNYAEVVNKPTRHGAINLSSRRLNEE